jgi:hypothetical protein
MEDLPIFEPTAANVSAFVGQTAYLPCRVRNLGDKVVSFHTFNTMRLSTLRLSAMSTNGFPYSFN